MNPEPCVERRRRAGTGRRPDRGIALLEALIGVLISAAVCLGMAYVSARTLNSQRFAATQTAAVSQLRGLLSHASDIGTLCSGAGSLSLSLSDSSASTFSVPTSVNCSFSTVTVTLSGTAISASSSSPVLSALSLSTTTSSQAVELFGGDGVISFSQ